MITENVSQEVLIVDDVPENLQLLAAILTGEDLEVSFANSGQQAIETVTFAPPDIILLDISMPEMDGFEVCRRLKENPDTKDIPVIFLTALTNPENIVKGFQTGGVDYVTKPFNTEELIARVKTHLELKRRREEVNEYTKRLMELNQEQILLNSVLNQQKNTIELKNKDLTDSIEYAKIIQSSLLTQNEKIKTLFKNSFLLFIPKDKVSGDFYFFEKIGDEIVAIVADCTGHGVPGAFVSVLGITLLIQIVKHDKITEPSEIHKLLDRQFIDILSENNGSDFITDGMDVAICRLNPNTNEMKFSGSKRPLLIRRGNQILKYKASLNSVGGYRCDFNKEFQSHIIELKKNDIIYLFSDGYADQFGGEKNKKFGTKRFGHLLKDLPADITKQKEKLLSVFYGWKGKQEQIDDVSIFAFKYQ